MRVSVLDQSPVITGHSPAQAVHETITGSYDSRLRSYELLAGAFAPVSAIAPDASLQRRGVTGHTGTPVCLTFS